MNCWLVLGIDSSASKEEIKKAFKDRAKKCHPDVRSDKAKAEAEFKELGQAYELALRLCGRTKKPVMSGWEDIFSDLDRKSRETPRGPPQPDELKVYRILSERKYTPASKTWTGVEFIPSEMALRGGCMFCILNDEEFVIRVPPFKMAMWMDAYVTLKNGDRIKMKIGVDDKESY